MDVRNIQYQKIRSLHQSFCLKIMKQFFFLSNPKRIMQIRVLFQHLRQEI